MACSEAEGDKAACAYRHVDGTVAFMIQTAPLSIHQSGRRHAEDAELHGVSVTAQSKLRLAAWQDFLAPQTTRVCGARKSCQAARRSLL